MSWRSHDCSSIDSPPPRLSCILYPWKCSCQGILASETTATHRASLNPESRQFATAEANPSSPSPKAQLTLCHPRAGRASKGLVNYGKKRSQIEKVIDHQAHAISNAPGQRHGLFTRSGWGTQTAIPTCRYFCFRLQQSSYPRW